MEQQQPLSPGKATEKIRAIANGDPKVSLKIHAKEQMAERSLVMGDVLYVLKRGFVYDEAAESTRPGFFKYKMECSTPNSNGRQVAVIVIAGRSRELKIVTVMWVDEVRVGR